MSENPVGKSRLCKIIDLVPVIGRKNRVYEILARKRPLTLRMIEGLHEVFSIPAESLLKHSSEHDSHAA